MEVKFRGKNINEFVHIVMTCYLDTENGNVIDTKIEYVDHFIA